jgi:sensor domain DACNV-containing protein
MPQTNSTPKDLAQAVCSELMRQGSECPKLEVLIDLFEVMYYVSLKTEESAPISFDLVYLNPKGADPIEPPSRLPNDKWRDIQLAEPIPVNMSNLIKIAKASDLRTSSLAIYHDEHEQLFLWGFVDQGNSYTDYVNYESETEVARPGLFQASIMGIGHLVAFIKMKKVAELKINSLVTSVSDVLQEGPIRAALTPGIEAYLAAVKMGVPKDKYKDPSQWEPRLISHWLKSLCRLLLRIQKYRHGGAVLITPENSGSELNIKYELPYDRLRSALENQASLLIKSSHARDQIYGAYIDQDAEEIPVELYLDRSIARRDLEETRRELEGTIWFLSLLTRVDGLVLLNQSLELQGFGVEITHKDEPLGIFMAGDTNATDTDLRSIDYNHYGTRHRSMMRYCSKVDGSVGFVISQDGDVRALTRVRGQLVMWENIKLQLPDYAAEQTIPLGE